MQNSYSFKKASKRNGIAELKKTWLKSLTGPQDGMWESFRDHSTHWEIRNAGDLIGYACVNEEHELLQFYLRPRYLSQGAKIFQKYLADTGIHRGIVGTNNPVYLSLALIFAQEVGIHTYLFRAGFEVDIHEKEGVLKVCQQEDIERIVAFCHYSIHAPVDWLNGYISGLVAKAEIFVFEHEDNILGTCEVRSSQTAPAFADIGMIVSPEFRKQGYGTYLLSRAKQIAKERQKEPICSCEKDNLGSFKSISNCGFISMHQLLAIDF